MDEVIPFSARTAVEPEQLHTEAELALAAFLHQVHDHAVRLDATAFRQRERQLKQVSQWRERLTCAVFLGFGVNEYAAEADVARHVPRFRTTPTHLYGDLVCVSKLPTLRAIHALTPA